LHRNIPFLEKRGFERFLAKSPEASRPVIEFVFGVALGIGQSAQHA
jgi:hypothetical protein